MPNSLTRVTQEEYDAKEFELEEEHRKMRAIERQIDYLKQEEEELTVDYSGREAKALEIQEWLSGHFVPTEIGQE